MDAAFAELAFPNNYRLPAYIVERLEISPISFAIAR